ncbi:hypothetical protein [Tropicimonas aquimaris]|uniref:Uncharacterized protein n=1 Tax=Tropicimonas aquimaris TaxID=914152 RepID=A0ABW3IUM9_9RHOB
MLASGASVEDVAARAAMAAERATRAATDDPAFLAAARLLVELPLAARGPGFDRYLEEQGIASGSLDDSVSFLAALSDALDHTPATTDLGEMARATFVSAVASELDRRLPQLFPAGPADIRAALGKLAGGNDFAEFARAFFAGLTHRTLQYYLSRELARHTGEDRRFATDAARMAFDRVLERHTWEAAGIVREFASGWYGKNVWQGDGPTPEKIANFSAYAFTKLRKELARRRELD